MGMSSFGEIARLTDLAPPEVGIVGNVGSAHIEFFGSQDRIARAKAEMVDGIKPGGTVVLNADDPWVNCMGQRRQDIRVVTFGIEALADCMARKIAGEGDLSGTRFLLVTPTGEAEVRLPLMGNHNVYNALAASAAGHASGLPAQVIAEQLARATVSKMRGEVLKFGNGMTVIDDSYNSNPQALLQSVRAMCSAQGVKRRIVVAGEMLELGAAGAEMHRHCGHTIAAWKIDRLIGVRGLARALVAGAMEYGMAPYQATFSASPEEAAAILVKEAAAGDLILVKGSRGVRTEKVIEKLKEHFEQTLQKRE
jgi:UDP-N-acetylmuramoyl-tripeptide--D-alanyl-D-alanine ligase